MKKTKMMCCCILFALINSVVFAQISWNVYNELYSEIIRKDAVNIKDADGNIKGSDVTFYGIRERLYARVDHDMFSVEGRIGALIGYQNEGYKNGQIVPGKQELYFGINGLKYNAWLRPIAALEIAAGNTLDYRFQGMQMKARDQYQDVDDGTWAKNSFAILVKPFGGLKVGAAIDFDDITNLANKFPMGFSAEYVFGKAGSLGIRFRDQFMMASGVNGNRNRLIGIHGNLTLIPKLDLAAGFSIHLGDKGNKGGAGILDEAQENAYILDVSAIYGIGIVNLAADVSFGFGDYYIREVTLENGEKENKMIQPVVFSVYGDIALKKWVPGLSFWIRATFGINNSEGYVFNNKTNKADSVKEGAFYMDFKPRVRYNITANDRLELGTNLIFKKPTKDDNLAFGIGIPFLWRHFIR